MGAPLLPGAAVTDPDAVPEPDSGMRKRTCPGAQTEEPYGIESPVVTPHAHGAEWLH